MIYKMIVRGGLCSLLLLTGFCNDANNPAGPQPPIITAQQTYGSFIIKLVTADDASDSYTEVSGGMNDGPNPMPVVYDQDAVSGSCKLLIPRIPVCSPSCGSDRMCVEDDSCMAYPSLVYAGKISVSGVKTKSGETQFVIDTSKSVYKMPKLTSAAYPPFAEGDVISYAAVGSATMSAFTLSTKGISPLVIITDTIFAVDKQPIKVQWVPPVSAGNSTIEVAIDISHHGGTKGVIEGTFPDNGTLEIPAGLVDKLKALGVSGYPRIEITRKSVGTSTVTNATLEIESNVTKILHIPGFISCPGEEEGECPDKQTCNQSTKLCE